MTRFTQVSLIGAAIFLTGLAGLAFFVSRGKNPPAGPPTVKIFFRNSRIGAQNGCDSVFPVTRRISGLNDSRSLYTVVIAELIKGPSAEEKIAGYFTSLPANARLEYFFIENNIAYPDFNEALEPDPGDACRISAIRRQITYTLRQFSAVQKVVISVDGQSEEPPL